MGTYSFAVFEIPCRFLERVASRCWRYVLVGAVALGAVVITA